MSATSPPPASVGYTPPGPVPRRRGWLIPAVVAAVVVAVVVAALFATGVVHFGSSSSNPAYETFSQAESVAAGNTGSAGGGSWYAAFGVGLFSPTALLIATTNLSELSSINCTFTWPHGEPANIEVPATGSTAGTGAAALWEFGFKNASNALLVVTVSDGTPSNLLVISGSLCEGYVALLAPFPTGVLDSPAVVSAADQAGGSAFLAAHPNASRIWGAYGGVQIGDLGATSPLWFVDYTTCALPGYSGETGAVFNATIGGTSGAVINSSSGVESCAPTLPSDLVAPLPAGALATAARKAI